MPYDYTIPVVCVIHMKILKKSTWTCESGLRNWGEIINKLNKKD